MSAVIPNILIPDNIQDGQLLSLPPGVVEEQPGFNLRTHYAPKEQAELDASVAKQGVLQNLVIRPQPGRPGYFWIIAGHRRHRSAVKANLATIPCLFRIADDRQALAIAAIENNDRANISPAEEAQGAQRMLDACDGDKDEVLRLLGWSRDKLEARLLLLHADESVLKALAEGRIKLGHAEYLSRMPKAVQAKNLPAIIEKGYTVAEVKRRIDGIAQKLSSAIFDMEGCAGCPHNSDTQQQVSLFSDMPAGECANPECFGQKSMVALEEMRQELLKEYPAVFLDVEKDASSRTFLVKTGRAGVGPKQFDACKGCINFGALLSSAPGSVGEVTKDICFDLACNGRKVAEYKQQLAKKQSEKREQDKTFTKGKKPEEKPPAKAKKRRTSVSGSPKKVIKEAQLFLRQQAAEVAGRDPATIQALTLYALLKDADKLSLLSKKPLKRWEAVHMLHQMPDDKLAELQLQAVQHQLLEQTSRWNKDDDEMVNTAIQIIITTETDLTGKFKLERPFLEAHTKSGIESLLKDAASPTGEKFIPWYEGDGKGRTLKRLLGLKSKELINTILSCGFDFSNWVPACILDELGKLKKRSKN